MHDTHLSDKTRLLIIGVGVSKLGTTANSLMGWATEIVFILAIVIDKEVVETETSFLI